MEKRRKCRWRERTRGGRTTLMLWRRRPPSPTTLRSVIIYVMVTISQPLSIRLAHQGTPPAMLSSMLTRSEKEREMGLIKKKFKDKYVDMDFCILFFQVQRKNTVQ